jgi:hypothetical protein
LKGLGFEGRAHMIGISDLIRETLERSFTLPPCEIAIYEEISLQKIPGGFPTSRTIKNTFPLFI